MKRKYVISGCLIPTLILAGLFLLTIFSDGDWRTASRESAGIAPDPSITKEAVVHVYGARTWGWRGWIAIHTWIAAKRTGEESYTVYDVVGWRGRRGQPVLRITQDIPDRYWYGAEPQILKAHQGEGVDELIDAIDHAAKAYPWKATHQTFPGPNSNTFTAWIARQVLELQLDLPFSAIGNPFTQFFGAPIWDTTFIQYPYASAYRRASVYLKVTLSEMPPIDIILDPDICPRRHFRSRLAHYR